MEDLFSLIISLAVGLLGNLLPEKLVDWIYAQPKFIRYLVISVFYLICLAIGIAIFLLILLLLDKIYDFIRWIFSMIC